MIVSRGAHLLRRLHLLKGTDNVPQLLRQSHNWNYRIAGAPPPKIITHCAEGVAGFAWWWILWHLWTEPGHVFGEFEFPDASKWTDEELGIPPDE